MSREDDAKRFAAVILRDLERTRGRSPATRWLAPRVALAVIQSQIEGRELALDLAVRKLEDAKRDLATACVRSRAAMRALELRLRDRAKAARAEARRHYDALQCWIDAAAVFSRVVPVSTGSPCFECGLVYRSPDHRDRHTCSAKPRVPVDAFTRYASSAEPLTTDGKREHSD